METKTVTVVKDFSKTPTFKHSSLSIRGNGAKFRDDVLIPALKENDKVHVVLTGYNRYSRSWLEEVFGGLLRSKAVKQSKIDLMTYEHSDVTIVNDIISSFLGRSTK